MLEEEDIQVGRLYKRIYENEYPKKYHELDVVVITDIVENMWSEYSIQFFYLNDPDEECEWDYGAFQDGMTRV